MRAAVTVIALAWFIQPASGQDCKSIADPAARLACFDKPAKAPVQKTKKAVVTDEFAEVKAFISRKLTDPESARFEDLFKVQSDRGEAVCGLVNAKNRMGGYAGAAGFIYEKSSRTGTIMFSGGSDPDYSGPQAAAYCVYCTPSGRGDRNIVEHCPSLINSYRK